MGMDAKATTQVVGTVGAAVSFIPVVGQVAGPIIMAIAPLIGKWFGTKAMTTGGYKLGEKYNKFVLGNTSITSYKKVTDDLVVAAQAFFEALLGVECSNMESFDALQISGSAYLDRDARAKLRDKYTQQQADLASTIAKHYPMENKGNNSKWDCSYWYAANFATKNPYDNTVSLNTNGQVMNAIQSGSIAPPKTGVTVSPTSGLTSSFQDLPEFSKTFVQENPLKTYWPLWGFPLIGAAGILLYKFAKKKRWIK